MPILETTRKQLEEAAFLPCPIASQHAQRDGKADLQLTSYSWVGPLGTRAKCAYLVGPRAEIINLMIYPNNTIQVPVFAVELILFGKVPRVAVIDLQPCAGLRRSPKLTALVEVALQGQHRYFQSLLSPGGDLPDWALDYFTPWAIYSRPQELAELPHLISGFESYLQIWMEHFLPQETPELHQPDDLREYQHHHVENTPGRKFLTTSFGSEWTEAYLSEFMYAHGEAA